MAPRRRKKEEEEADVWGSAAADLERALTKVRRGERIVSLFQTGPGQGAGDAGAADLAKALQDAQAQVLNQGLVSLRLRGHQVGDEGAGHLAKALQGDAGRLHTLDVGGNRIDDAGAVLLSQALAGSRLRVLDLSGNKFGDGAMSELAKALPQKLEQLDLTGNQIGSEGVKVLADVVKNHPLKELSIGENHTGDAAATYLAQAFGEACGLTVLHFSWSGLTDAGASILASRLARQPKLRELQLTNNKIEDVGALALAKALEEHRQLRLLGLDKNQITDVAILEFVSALVRMDKKDLTCSLSHNPSKRFDEDSLRNLNMVAATVRAISKRCVSLEMMLKFFKDYTSVGRIAHQSSTTEEVVKEVIRPESDKYGVCYSEFYHTFSPEYYVVHCWQALFSDLLMGVATHASGFTQPKLDPSHEQYIRRPEALLRRYFVDIFCIDQVRKFPQHHPRCETDKFDLVLQEASRHSTKLLVTMDRDHTPMARSWCLAEVCFAKLCSMSILVSFGPIHPMPRRRKGMIFKNTEASLEADAELLRQELMLRGPGIGEKFENEVVEPLQKQATDTYTAVYESMPLDQQKDCDWVKAQDDAREDMKMYGRQGNAEKMRVAVQAGIDSQVEDSTMEPNRRRLAQLELEMVLNLEANYSLLEHISELRRTLQASEEEKLEDPPLISRGRARLAEQEAEARRLDAQQELLKSTKQGQKLSDRWQLQQKNKKRTNPEAPLVEVPVIKLQKQMGGQEKKEEEWRRQKVQGEKALVKGLRLAFEEGEAAGCDREVIDHCRRVYSELRVFTSAQWTIRRLAEEQAAQRAAEEAARQKAERAAAKAAEREARRKAAEEKGEDFEESEDESEDENRFYDEEADDDEDKEDPKDVEDGSVQTICAALQRGREAGGQHEVRDFGKAFLKELDLQVYHQYLLQEMTFSASQRSAAELKHVLQQVVAEGLGPPPDTKPRSAQKEIAAQERPGARRFLQEASAGKPADANRAPAESAEPADVTPEPAESAKPADAPQERTEESADLADVTLEPAESGKSADIAPEPAESAQLADITPEPVESAKPADTTPEPESGKPADITPEPAESAKPVDAPEPAEAEPAEETTAKSGQDGEDGEAAGDHKAEAGPADAVIKAHTRLAFLEMADAMEARDLPELLRLVPAAETADVEETEVALGWRLIRELQLAESVKKQNLKEIRLRLEKAREAQVQDEVLHNAGRKLANWEIREGTSQGNAKMLERAIAEGRAAGLTEKQLFSGKHALLKLQVAALVSTEMPEEIRKLLAMAEGMGMPPDSKELEQPKSRLALLELREAIEGTDAKKLQACMDAAKEHHVDGEELEKGSFRLRVLELQEASRDFDAERLREAMQDAKAAGVPKSLFPPAKRKLADLNPEALSEWMLEELEEAVTSLSAEDPSAQLRPILEEAIAAKVNEEDIKPAEEKLAKMELKEAATMTDRFDVERILNTAQVYGWDLSKGSMGALYEAADVNRKNLIMKERKAECKDSLEFAIMSMDLELLRQHIKEAQDLGLDKEVIEKAEAIYQDYA